ncbi:hypothetical protein SAMN02745119_02788 [Trichlorobacter thiogenes]|uniref:Uncharacterized protein n=1 Tax=Trichlorobacter thiogenes TaxID=115783 RepID=A0A1T4RBV2_9BACT|nr:hypothetical protein [Trichlorobacter thiogenes]SKA13435.1 hypothetical protein SAMN02745119_02788 [Trichlorobacter thiogenes]
MNRYLRYAGFCLVALLPFGCATAPQTVYVTEAQQVTTMALEPVNLDSIGLKQDLGSKFSRQLPSEMTDELMNDVQAQLANTKRFTKVLMNASDQETYIIEPRIESLNAFESPMNMDPTRKQVTFKARVRLDVKFMNTKGQIELVKSYSDDRKLETKIPKREVMVAEKKQEFFKRAVTVGFRAAADRLGMGFNPSYEMGSISRVNGRIAYVQINTTKLRKVPKKQQAIEVVDENNQVLASMGELQIEDGSISGRYFEKGGASVKEGMKVRARVNAMLLD